MLFFVFVFFLQFSKALPNQTHLDLFKDVEKGFPIQVSEFLLPISECNLTPDDRR